MARTGPGTRERMIVSTALLVRERGARATSIDDVLRHSGAPRGSVYHHFPGGREQLLREATDYAGRFVAGALERTPAGDPVAALDAFLDGYRKDLVANDFRTGCPVVAVAVESRDGDSDLRAPAAAAFSRWQRLLADRFAAAGIHADRADDLALMAISAIEGALVLSRAHRDAAPLDSVRRQLRALLQSETTPDRSE
jgi:AcrR family transcriptional regulator